LKKIFQYYFPITLLLFSCVTLKYRVVTDGGYDRLYGFPLPFISSTYAFTGHRDVYIFPLIVDVTVYFGVSALVIFLFEKWVFHLKTNVLVGIIASIVTLLFIFWFYINTFESSFELRNTSWHIIENFSIYFGLFP